MAEKNYAFIKGSEVVNIAVFDSPSDDLLSHFKEFYDLDSIVEATSQTIIGGTYDGVKFWLPKPFPSWLKDDETNQWVAPVPKPAFDEKNPTFYEWDETNLSWKEVIG
jgi:hypothetical protein